MVLDASRNAPGVGFEPTTKGLQGFHHFHDGLDYLFILRLSALGGSFWDGGRSWGDYSFVTP